MSIIYEALKKTQKKREAIKDIKVAINKFNRNKHKFSLKLLIIPSIVLASLLISYAGFQQYTTNKAAKARQHLTLSGVFLTGQDKYAMINNQAYKVGDKIGDMAVVSIDMDDVKLMDANLGLTTLKITI